MARGQHRLSARKCETAGTGRHQDGGGLILRVTPSGAKSWVLRYTANGKRRDMGLGAYPAIGLAKAREIAARHRELIAQKIDPLDQPSPTRMTFREAATAVHKSKLPTWRNKQHGRQWIASLENHVFPALGDKDVARIATNDILNCLRPLWQKHPVTASRLRHRIEAVLSYAKVADARTGENPARWRDHLAHALPSPTKAHRVKPMAAAEWQDVPKIYRALELQGGIASLALTLMILCTSRPGEVIGAQWADIDLDGAVWTIPPERMKRERPHRVPLTEPALGVLHRVKGLAPDLVFPSGRRRKPLTHAGLIAALRRVTVCRSVGTPHGLRSSFRDWCAEATTTPTEVIERQLSHRVGDDTVEAYFRTDLLAKRRELLKQWAAFVAGNHKCRIDDTAECGK